MKTTLVLDGLCCANCARKIETAVRKIEGVESANLNFMVEKLIIEAADEKMPEILEKATDIIKKTEPDVVIKRL